MLGGADVVVLEARDRVGGRVEQVSVDDGRPVQLGGELVGRAHAAYLGLVEELGLTLDLDVHGRGGCDDVRPRRRRPSARRTVSLRDAQRQRADYERVERLFGELVATVDPDDPWSHPDAIALDDVSVGLVAALGRRAAGDVRAIEAGALALAAGSSERRRFWRSFGKAAAVGDDGFYSYDLWESLQVAEGSAEVALRMGAELGDRIRLGARSHRLGLVTAEVCRVRLASGEEVRAEAVVCALPVSVLHGVRIEGVSRSASPRSARSGMRARRRS